MTKIYPSASRVAHPPIESERYGVSAVFAPTKPLLKVPGIMPSRAEPVYGNGLIRPDENDLTKRYGADPMGQRIMLYGRVMDEDGRGVPGTLVEMWQANSAGKYVHGGDEFDAPLDPNFDGAGRTITGEDGSFTFHTIKPGCYPFVGEIFQFWRSSHIHFSVFGPTFVERLVTQMYFPGDPLAAQDPVFQGVTDPAAQARMICVPDLEKVSPTEGVLAYRYDIVLRGRNATPQDTH
jgi:protocatechuate 3,4-dioxygenase beta subunit